MAPGPQPSELKPSHVFSGRRVETGFLLLGCAALGFCGLVSTEAGLYQAVQNRRLDKALERAATAKPERASIDPIRAAAGSLVGRIEIPRLALSAVIREGSDTHTLLIAVGHVSGTAFPGDDGNVVVSGHRDSFFRDLKEIRPEDEVRIVTLRGVYQYRVDSTTVVGSEQTEVLDPTEEQTLTLITCYPFDYIGPAPKRFVVRARQVKGLA